jgi:negative regulator of sigma E activity
MTNERLSDWMDGELDEEDSARVFRSVMQHPDEREACEIFWLIGDALRDSAQPMLLTHLAGRVMDSLGAEPTVLAPKPQLPARSPGVDRWLPAAAAVAGVTVAAWMGLSLLEPSRDGMQPAIAVAQPAASSAPATVALSGEQAYYMAHQASAIGAPMAGVAQYIRMVGDEQTGRR